MLPRFVTTTEGKFLSAVILIIIALFAYYFYAAPSSSDGGGATISFGENDHVRGAVNGTVTLVKFVDFQCPACRAYEPVVKQVMAENPTTLKVVHRNFPLTQIHKNALPAAIAAEAAGLQGKFWEMSDMLYEKQTEWGGALNARDYFLTYATTLGLDTQKFQADLSDASLESRILAEYKEGIRLQVQGTPTFFLNGKKLENPVDVAAFNELIKEALGSTSASSTQ